MRWLPNREVYESSADNLAAIAGGNVSFRNRLINPSGNINQRGYVSGTATGGANQYTVDRWRVVTSGQALSWTTSGIDKVFTAPAGGVEQVIEGLNLEGGTFSLSWTGTATATVGGVAVLNGKSIAVTAGADLAVRFIGGTFSKPQFEIGGVTTFERRMIGTELGLCHRYYQVLGKSLDSELYFYQTTTTAALSVVFVVPLICEMRANPIVTKVGTWAVVNCAQPIIAFTSKQRFTIYAMSVASGLVQFHNATAASQYITADAEL